MTITRVAALQMVSGNCLQENLIVAERLIGEAAKEGAKLLVLPETFAQFGTRLQKPLGHEEAFGDSVVRPFVTQQAKRHGVWIVAGSIPLSPMLNSERVLAACYVVDDQGNECARFDKLHLFDVDVGDQQGSYRESDTFIAGEQVVVVPTPFGRLGLAICYDIRFPELFRAMFELGVDIVAVPAAFTLLTGRAHWLALLRARAIENQCYIIGANQGGQHSPSRTTSGESVIIDGWGTVLAQADSGESCVIADVDLKKLQRQRLAMPIKQHQRFSVIKKE
ncbi:MAG: carbon-nitrogen hydrolase family protein [Spongiibacteraceae bacterium]|nr:carbon-nitrogen hydrolase family protein [Spongiibacteraceae bacterium]